MDHLFSVFTPVGTIQTVHRNQTSLIAAALVIAWLGACSPAERSLGTDAGTPTGTLAEPTFLSAALSTASVATVTVFPRAFSLLPGTTQQLSLSLKDAAGNKLSGRVITWRSSMPGVASVSPTGLVRALAPGSSLITATSEGRSGTATVTITSGINWVFTNGLETGNPFNTSFTHPGGSVLRTTQRPYSGLYSLKFTTPSRIYQKASVAKYFPYGNKTHAVDLWFYIPAGQADNALEISIEGWSGTQKHLSSVMWKKDSRYGILGWFRWVNGRWAYLPGGQGVPVSQGTWHRLRVEMDYVKRQYRKLVIDGREFDLRGLSYDVTASTTAPSLVVSILLWCTTAQSVSAFVDDVQVGVGQ